MLCVLPFLRRTSSSVSYLMFVVKSLLNGLANCKCRMTLDELDLDGRKKCGNVRTLKNAISLFLGAFSVLNLVREYLNRFVQRCIAIAGILHLQGIN